MRLSFVPLLLLAASMLGPDASYAGASDWHETNGARIRLVTAGQPEPDGSLHGALEIALEPGWKTYWRDPGDAGIPPQIDVSPSTNIAGAAIEFPPPVRFHEGWAGYDRSVSLPVRFSIDDPARFSAVEADIFLGVCKEVCVPVQARLSATQHTLDGEAENDAAVAAAFATLPGPTAPNFRVDSLRDDGDSIVATITLPGGTTADLFVVTPEGWVFGPPEAVAGEGGLSFSILVAERPAGTAAVPVMVDYTLVAGAASVSGTTPLH